MRRVLAVTIALALFAPAAAGAARTDASTDISQMVSAYQRVHVVRVIERFDNGAVATVDVMPAGQYRVASTGGQDPVLIVKLATQPVPNIAPGDTSYYLQSLGTKTFDGVKANGYTITKKAGGYVVSVWFNEKHLPVMADVDTEGHKVNLLFGDYDNSMLIGTAPKPGL